MRIQKLFGVMAIVLLTLCACGGQDEPIAASQPAAPAPATALPATLVPSATTSPATEDAQATPVAETTIVESPTPEEIVEPTAEAIARPAWQSLPLTNAQTGTSFTLADFAGKTVYVEPFATWCTKCREQLNNVKQARANFGDDVVFIVLSVEPNIGNDALAQYASDEGFDFIFAAMSPELLRELVGVLGQTITNPPATPHFIIRADGSNTELFTGIEGPEAITALIQSAQS